MINFMFLGGHKVAPNATKHLVTELTDWSCTDPQCLHRLQPPLGRENLQQHVIHLSTTYRSRILLFIYFFLFLPSVCVSVFLYRLSKTSVFEYVPISLTGTLLGANTSGGSGGGEICDLYTHEPSAHFCSTHPDTKLCRNSSVSLSLCFFIFRPTLNLQQLVSS